MRIAVLGAGPAGLLAAHAVREYGAEPDVFAAGARSDVAGSQWLQQPIPGVTDRVESADIWVGLLGTGVVYAEKGGGDPERGSSWEEHGSQRVYRAWPLRDVYNMLWDENRVIPTRISPETFPGYLGSYDLVISTIPPQAYCQRPAEHYFSWYSQWIEDAWPDDAGPFPDRNVIIYSGDRAKKWVRASHIFGYASTEWPPDHRGAGRSVRKPIKTNCDCATEYKQLVRLGRYGQWNAAGLVHDAYYGAWGALHPSPPIAAQGTMVPFPEEYT